MTQQRPSLPSVQRSPYLCHYADKCRTRAIHAPIEEVNNAITLKKYNTFRENLRLKNLWSIVLINSTSYSTMLEGSDQHALKQIKR